MKQVKIFTLKDGETFWISNRPESVEYTLQSKERGKAVYTSNDSGRTFRCSLKKKVYPSKDLTGPSCV